MAKGLKYIERHVQADGGIYTPNSGHRNYETSIASGLTAANNDGRYDKTRAEAKVPHREQWGGGKKANVERITSLSAAPVTADKRPDLSNTSFLIEALKAAGNGRRRGHADGR